ncbi:MAG: HAD family phosphatase [Gemmataceae bacterium]
MQTIVFDFGNVIAFFDHYRALAKMQAHTDLTQEAMYQSVYVGELEDLFEKGALDEPEFLRRVIALWRLRCGPDPLAEAIADIFEPNPEVCELIPRLARRYRLLLGSNTNAIHARKFLGQFEEVLSHFDRLILSYEIGARKPALPFFERCLEHAGCKPEECLFIDDLPANIEGARRAGLRGLVYQRGDGLTRRLRDLGIAP